MKTNFSFVLTAPHALAWVGARNPPIFKKAELVDLTPDLLANVLAKSVPVNTQWITAGAKEISKGFLLSYHAPSNTFHVWMRMESSSRKYFEHLIKMGWELDEEVAKRYEFPKS